MQPRILIKVIRELGLQVLINQVYYQSLLKLGLAEFLTRKAPQKCDPSTISTLNLNTSHINKISAETKKTIIDQADRICSCDYKPYGSAWQPLIFPSLEPLQHWTVFDKDPALAGAEDIKDIWEPSRFGWAVQLANAYLITKDEKYAFRFWEKWEEWQKANPPYYGPNWISAQEVAIRISVFSFLNSIFIESKASTPARKDALSLSIYQHACRIPPTLSYARAQRNNHLLSEAAGLITAGFLFSSSSRGKRWLSLGWKLFNQGLEDQIDPDGVYIQHSINYHRLMLQLAVWVDFIRRPAGLEWPHKSLQALQKATEWLSAMIEPATGISPNQGHNDGSDLFPIGNTAISDYRPILQAAYRVFCQRSFLLPGDWDEFCTLLVYQDLKNVNNDAKYITQPSTNLILGNKINRGYIHIPHFSGRPAQADLLHVDIWRNAHPLTLDPGTYRYNAVEPWQNGLARTICHNTITADNLDQMTRFSRFLWVDKAKTRIVEKDANRILAEHDGYRSIGFFHQRALAWLEPDTWLVTDAILPAGTEHSGSTHTICLHWLIPQIPWKITDKGIIVEYPDGKATILVNCNLPVQLTVICAGEYLYGSGQPQPTLGWFSPTYSEKTPALSFRWVIQTAQVPLTISSRFILGDD
ncbi:MAG TPA: alginate lyase family protein [Longilinea sp.]|nr:alginate lyase family protein [Longilinea sp.]